MKKIFLTLASLALLSSGKVLAWAGGPFDNGDPAGVLVERSGYYQATFSFLNGNGYGIFTPDSQFFGGLDASTGASSGAAFFDRGTLYTNNSFSATHSANRSVFYYKGITYVGACMGFVDLEKRRIQGTANATSDSVTSVQQSASAGTTGSSLSNTSTIVQNNANFILNLGWEGFIKKTAPTLRFRGRGELTIVSPSGSATVASLAFRGFSQLIDAINQSLTNVTNPDYTGAQVAIQNALGALTPYLSSGSADQRYNESDRTKVKVFGSRRFF
ncbi:MAG: hypothetical protein KDK97_11460 [Verrucomicrobiales bacterium]|nr:hypothetical protein [Verrucomicrobiales bacterium]MCP5558162.1 hypothetical protein [Verrucomicrobiaceae bacterium]